MGRKKSSTRFEKQVKKPLINVLGYFLVPKMKILSEKEKQKLLSEYNISEETLPGMRSDDPTALALNAKKGNVVEIKREDPTKTHFHYRLVR